MQSQLIKNKNKVQFIRNRIPDNYNRYLDPHVGNGSVFMKIKPKKWLINDRNIDRYNMWRSIKRRPDALIKCISSNYFEDVSYHVRAAMFMYIQYNHHRNNGSFYENISKTSKFMNETDGQISNMEPNDFLFNLVERNDFVYISRPFISMDTLYFLDEKEVKWMAVYPNNFQIRESFKQHNIEPITFNEDEVLVKNF